MKCKCIVASGMKTSDSLANKGTMGIYIYIYTHTHVKAFKNWHGMTIYP